MRKHISQREAHRLKKRVQEMEFREDVRARCWSSEYPGGVRITTIALHAPDYAAIHTAQATGHAVVVKVSQKDVAQVYAVRRP